ncbi:N-acetyltransferase [Nakamurella silvestris]|nr:N-acetyltransferase [Nakamurella silvestris]
MREFNNYQFDDDRERLDHEVLWTFLSTDAYWGKWRTREDVRAGVDGSWRVVGCYSPVGQMVGFARATSDGVNFAYLGDVFVVPAHRGHGLGKELVREIIENGPGRDFRWMLNTSDAHTLYRGFGFAPGDSTVMVRPSAKG